MSIQSIADDFNSGTISGGDAVQQAMSEGYSYDEAVSQLTEAITSSTPEGVTYEGSYAMQPENQDQPYTPPPIPNQPSVGYTPPPTTTTTTPAPPKPTGPSAELVSNVLKRYRAGEFGTVGSYTARQGAAQVLATEWKKTGLSDVDALATGIEQINGLLGVNVAGGASDRAAGQPELGFQAQRALDFSGTAEGRGELFRDYLAGLPGAPDVVERARERAFKPYSQSFEIGQGLGTVGPEATFDKYLPETFGPINREFFRNQLENVGSLLGGPEPASLAAAAYREALLGSPEKQHNLAFEGVRPYIAPAFQAGAKNIGSERFGRAQDVNLIAGGFGGTQANPFAQYLHAEGGFAGPTQAEYRAAAQRAAGLLGGGKTTGLAEDLRQTLLDDPDRQFDLALRYQTPDVPFALRPAFGKRAERTYRQFGLQSDPMTNPWLAYFAGRGYQF